MHLKQIDRKLNQAIMLLTIFLLFIVMLATAYELANPDFFKEMKQSGTLFAKMTPGAIVSEIRGKIAATVFARNKGGQVIRNRITPINRRSVGQSSQRQLLAALAAQWRGLTQAQRDSWNAAAPNFPQSDNLGQTIYLSGEQLYVRCNANLVLIGQSQITTAPAPTSFATLAFTSLTATADDQAISLAFTPTVPTGYNLVVRATAPLSAGKDFVSPSAFRFITNLAAAATSPADLATVYANVFGSIVNGTGQKIFIEMFLVEIASGLAGQKVRGFGVIAAT